MSRLSILLFAAVTACGGKSSTAPVSPLPADPAPEPAPAVAEPAPEPAPPVQLAPVEVTLPAAPVRIKMVSAGKGTKAALRYTPKAGDTQRAEIAMDFTAKQSETGQVAQDQIVPTIVLSGDVETTSVDAGGGAEYTLTVNTTDARDVPGSQLPAEKFRIVLASLDGLTISSKLDANGTSGDVKLRIEKPTEMSAGALELIRLTLPKLPVLPIGPVGVGAKWQVTTTSKLADKLDVQQVTDYELVAHKGTTWTIKGKTKVTGADQEMEGGKISGIKGSGTSEATIADGTLFPLFKSSLETQFTAAEAGKSMQFALKVGGTVTPATK